jgi:putative ABC transport system substrate-binding protein
LNEAREFVALLGGTTVTWSFIARAQQQRDRARRIGVLIPFTEDAETQALVVAFGQRFQELGWTEGRNVQLDYHYTDGSRTYP